MKYQELTNTEEKKASAISAFTNLLNHPGWKLVEAILEDSLESIREKLENPTEDKEETKEDVDILRHTLKLTKDLRNMPLDEINRLQKIENEVPSSDPYDTIESLKKKRNEAT